MEGLWSIITIVGPLVLLAILIFAVIANRASRRDKGTTEAGTRALYAEEDKKTQRDEAV